MFERKKPFPLLHSYVTNRKGSTDGHEAHSVIPASKTLLGHKKPRTSLSLHIEPEDVERLESLPQATVKRDKRGRVKMVTYFRAAGSRTGEQPEPPAAPESS